MGHAAEAGVDGHDFHDCNHRLGSGGGLKNSDDNVQHRDYNDPRGDCPGSNPPGGTAFIALIAFSCDILDAKPLP